MNKQGNWVKSWLFSGVSVRKNDLRISKIEDHRSLDFDTYLFAKII